MSSLPDILAQARALQQRGQSAEALALLDGARKKESSPALWLLMAEVFSGLGMDDAQEQVLREGLKNHAQDLPLLLTLAQYLYRADRSREGLEVLQPFVRGDAPTPLRLTYASLLRATGDADKAQKEFERVLAKEPKNVPALSNLAGIYLDARDYENARALFERAHALEKTNAHIANQLAQVYFRMGDLEKAWAANEARFGLIANDPHAIAKRRPFSQPVWQGQKLGPEDTLLLYGEQGIGEEILHASMLPDAAARVEKIAVECDARLVPLFQRSFPNTSFFARRDPPDERTSPATYQAPLGQLGKLFRKSFTDFPKREAYLKADAQKTAALQAKYRALKPDGKIIGVSWKSKKLRQGDPKSTALADWKPVLENSPHLFINLQYGLTPDELAGNPVYTDAEIDQSKSLDDFAAQVAAMDAVITVSNTTAHMAGALGIRSAVLLPASRGLMGHWFDNRDDSPWYPSLTLLRQKTDGDWANMMRRAADFIR